MISSRWALVHEAQQHDDSDEQQAEIWAGEGQHGEAEGTPSLVWGSESGWETVRVKQGAQTPWDAW